MRARLVGEQIRNHAAPRQLRNHVGTISNQSNRRRLARTHGVLQNAQRFVEIVHHHIAVTALHAPLDALRIHVDPQKRRAIQRRCQRLRAAHPAHAAARHKFPGKVRSMEMLPPRRRKSFVRPLKNSLRPNVNPAAGGHLPVHHQAGSIELVEMFPIAPMSH